MNIPDTKEAWEETKTLFLIKYQVEDSPETWTFILSQIQNVKMPELTFDPETIYAYYKRWKIAKVLQDEKTVYIAALEAKLKDKLEALAQEARENGSPSEHTEHLLNGTFHPEGDVPALQETQEGMVPAP